MEEPYRLSLNIVCNSLRERGYLLKAFQDLVEISESKYVSFAVSTVPRESLLEVEEYEDEDDYDEDEDDEDDDDEDE